MMGLFLPLTVFSTWILVVGARPTENQANETNVLTTMAQNRKQVTATTATPTSVQRSNVPSRKGITATHTKVVPPTSTAGPVQKDKDSHPNTGDLSMFFLTSDVTKLTILVIAQAAVLLVLVIVLVVLCILRRGMQRKMRRMKEKIKKDDEPPRDEGHVRKNDTPPPSEAPRNLPTNTQQQHVQYDVPYAHQQEMAVHTKKLAIEESTVANEKPPNNNHVPSQQRSNEFPVTYEVMDEDDYIKPRVLESIVGSIPTLEQNEPADPASDSEIYKVPRNSAKRSGLISDEASLDSSTLKDSKDYVVLMNYAGSLKGDDDRAKDSQVGTSRRMEEVKNAYDVPKTGRSTDTFSRRTIKTKIKIFQEKMKGDKTKHVENVDNKKLARKGLAKKNIAKCVTAYDEPRKGN